MTKSIKIASWNVNSVKSRLGHLITYLKSPQAPDILALQELKCETQLFPYMEIESLGYHVVAHGQKSYNGVAILSKYPIDETNVTLTGSHIDQAQSRFMECVISLPGEAIRLINLYVPNGQAPDSDKFAYKMHFYDSLYQHTKNTLLYNEKLILLGDFNVAPYAIDVYDPTRLEGTVCYHPKERAHLRALLGLGLTDVYRAVYPDTPQYSWWDYRANARNQNKGMRIDHLLLSPQAADQVLDAGVDCFTRDWDTPSDHAPVWCSLKLQA